jgi:hypothetical protein
MKNMLVIDPARQILGLGTDEIMNTADQVFLFFSLSSFFSFSPLLLHTLLFLFFYACGCDVASEWGLPCGLVWSFFDHQKRVFATIRRKEKGLRLTIDGRAFQLRLFCTVDYFSNNQNVFAYRNHR